MVALDGDRGVGHYAKVVLEPTGHSDWVAKTPEEYVQIAVKLASDLGKLQQIRQSLPQQLQSSPYFDSRQTMRDLEEAFLTIWQAAQSEPAFALVSTKGDRN